MRALLRFPSDPRIAMALAEQIAVRRYRTPMASRYYGPLYDALTELGDVRTIAKADVAYSEQVSAALRRFAQVTRVDVPSV